jgi:cyclophilin family peptidyl-prolyl cis-trans isomerase
MKKALSTLTIMLFGLSLSCWADEAISSNPRVRLETTMGNITLELNSKAAPKTVENFLSYVQSGFYNGTVFHRVMKGFMIQTGGLTKEMEKKPTRDQIKNEADNGLKNRRGTVAMARTGAPHSATAQFFVNTVDNAFLDHQNKSSRGWGYCVFGKVIKGMEVVFDIERVRVVTKMGRPNVPASPIILTQAIVVK